MGLQTDKHLPPGPFTGQNLRKDDIYDWNLLVIWSMVRSKRPRHSKIWGAATGAAVDEAELNKVQKTWPNWL